MTEHTELRIPYDDLKFISFECRGCGTEITMDISREDQLQADWENKGLRCTYCTMTFDLAVKHAIANYVQWYSLIKNSKQSVFFRLKKA